MSKFRFHHNNLLNKQKATKNRVTKRRRQRDLAKKQRR